MINALEQLKLIILYILLGIFSTICFDTFRFFIFSNKSKKRLILSYLLEILFWIFIIYINYIFIINNTSEYITIYSILLLFFGVFLYYTFIQDSYRIRLIFIKSKGKKIIIFLYPLLLPIDLIKWIIKKLKNIVKRISKKIKLSKDKKIKNKHKKAMES